MSKQELKPPRYHDEYYPPEGGMSTFIHKQPLIEAIGCAALLGVGGAIFWAVFRLSRLIPKQQNKN